MNKHERNLRFTLKINAVFSLTCGLSSLLFNNAIADIMRVQIPEILFYLGVGLILFSTLVFFNAFKKNISAKSVKSIVLQDWLWVIGSVVILIFQFFNLSDAGYVLILLIAIVVAVFAVLQTKFYEDTNNLDLR